MFAISRINKCESCIHKPMVNCNKRFSKMEKRKTIIFMAPTPPPYMGPSIATQIILNSRFVNEFHVIHIDTADRRPLNKMAKIDITNIYLALKHYCVLFHKLLLNKVDLVYIPISQMTIGFLRDFPFIVLSKLFKKKVILHLRGGYFREFYNSSGRIMKYIIRRTLAKIDMMIVLGECLKPLFEGLVPEEKISVVPNGADVPFDAGGNYTSHNDQITILFLSNLVEQKGFKDVLQSIPIVMASDADVKYVFAGTWMNDKDEIECKRFIEQNMLNEKVEFIGAIAGKQKANLLRHTDVFVFPTYYPMEGHPWVIVEAMAAGLPIITTDQGCIRESVINGENGYIVPHRDPKAIAEQTLRLIENPVLRKSMGLRSRELYEANFTKEHFVQRMIDTVNLTLNGK